MTTSAEGFVEYRPTVLVNEERNEWDWQRALSGRLFLLSASICPKHGILVCVFKTDDSLEPTPFTVGCAASRLSEQLSDVMEMAESLAADQSPPGGENN